VAAGGFKYDNFQALMAAAKGVLPYAVLFYAIDIFVWGGSDAAMIRNIEISSLFIGGFFVINFMRVRQRQKAIAMMPQQQVIVVQQPVYMQPPPGYGYAPGSPPQGALPPGYPPQGQPYYPQQYQQPYPQQPPQLPAQAPVTAPGPPPQPAPQPAPADQDSWLPPQPPRKPPPSEKGA
jgi:hypothetical protein